MFSFFKKCFFFIKKIFSKKKCKKNKIKSMLFSFKKEKNDFLPSLIEFILNEFGFAKYIKLYSILLRL